MSPRPLAQPCTSTPPCDADATRLALIMAWFARLRSSCLLWLLPLLVNTGSASKTPENTTQCTGCARWFPFTVLQRAHTQVCPGREPQRAAPAPAAVGGCGRSSALGSPELGSPGGMPPGNPAPDAATASFLAAAGLLFQPPGGQGPPEAPFAHAVEAYLVSCGMSGAQLQGLFDMFAPGTVYTPSKRLARDVIQRLLSSELGDKYTHIDVSTHLQLPESEGPLFLSVLKDPLAALLNLFASCDDDWSLDYKKLEHDGERAFNQAWTANRFQRVQVRCSAALQRPLPPARCCASQTS